MTVQELLEQLRHYPRDIDVVLVCEDRVCDVSKVRMKEVTVNEAPHIATDIDFDLDAATALAVVIYPEA